MTARFSSLRNISFASGLLLASAPSLIAAGPMPVAVSAFNAYSDAVETRLKQQHRSQAGFLASASAGSRPEQRLHQGESVLEQLTPSGGISLPGALLHHWRGTAFVRGATAEQLEKLLEDFGGYPQRFAPQVLEARVLAGTGDHVQVSMRVSQRHVVTVVMDSTYEVSFGRLDRQHGYSRSASTKIAEIDSPGTRNEHVLTAEQEHGFLWRQNTYWSYEEQDGGLYMQIESISLTRSIPTGLGWAVRPFVESVPRDSLEFTLRSVCNALHK
ncbi:MAG TPA: hypothetical protein VGU23_10570 [Acidobacteriaceae bacterium]|nr:hypothetical protein [Acidobacteriaceae bacterium]